MPHGKRYNNLKKKTDAAKTYAIGFVVVPAAGAPTIAVSPLIATVQPKPADAASLASKALGPDRHLRQPPRCAIQVRRCALPKADARH